MNLKPYIDRHIRTTEAHDIAIDLYVAAGEQLVLDLVTERFPDCKFEMIEGTLVWDRVEGKPQEPEINDFLTDFFDRANEVLDILNEEPA
jgi:hypothetical protein